MRNILFILLIFSITEAIGQNILFRDDSLFINSIYLKSTASKAELDKALGVIGKTKVKRERPIPCSKGPKSKVETYFYHDLGLFFRKYECDTSKYTFGIKLRSEVNKKNDNKRSELKNIFSGILIIGVDTISIGSNIIDLNQLKGSTITISRLSWGHINSILGGDLNYRETLIRLSFDKETEQLARMFIHYNFPKY